MKKTKTTHARWYTIYGILFGLCFPIASLIFLALTGLIEVSIDIVATIKRAHSAYPLLYVVDTTPLFLGFFARIAGKLQDKLEQINDQLRIETPEKSLDLRLTVDETESINEMAARMLHMAEYDVLTGLINRRRFYRNIEHWTKFCSRYKRDLSLLYLDIDNFNKMNGLHGKHAGDKYLIALSARLRKVLRSTDIMARWGGDEFVIMLSETAAQAATLVAEKIIKELNNEVFVIDSIPWQLTASMGIALFPAHGADAKQLVANSCAAMREAKRSGRHCWRIYSPPVVVKSSFSG